MNFDDIESAEAKVKRARALWQQLQAHFDNFVGFARRFAEADCPIKGISIDTPLPNEVFLGLVGRRVRVWMDFDRDAERGLLVVDDVTNCNSYDRKPVRIGTLAFDYSGATEVTGGYLPGTKANISQPGDAWHLTMSILHEALGVRLSDVGARA